MANRISRFCVAILRWGRLRPPPGHMDMLRGEVGRREDERLARSAATARRQAMPSQERHDADE